MKKQCSIAAFIRFCLFFAALFLVGCDGSDDGPEPPAVNVSGSWAVSLSGGGGSNVVLVQNGNSIQGTSDDGDQISGSIEGNSISVTAIEPTPGNRLQLDGTASETTMSGTYSGTIGGSEVGGTWSALKMTT